MADFKTYQHIEKWLGKGMKRTEGRKKRALMFRMLGDVIVVSHVRRAYANENNGRIWKLRDIAEIRPNNVLTFTTDSAGLIPCAASLTQVFPRVLGLEISRKGKGIYAVFPTPDGAHSTYWSEYRKARDKGYEHFNGMAWDWSANFCINPRKAIHAEVDTDARKVWVAQLKKFRRLFLTKAKLGVVQTIIDADSETGKRVHADELEDAIVAAIKAGDMQTDLIERLVTYSRRNNYRRVTSVSTVVKMLESIITNNSIKFRQEFGVLRK